MIRTFDQQGDFAAQAAAKQWLHERGYSVGIMEADAPRGIMRGDVLIAKWCNLSPREKRGYETDDGLWPSRERAKSYVAKWRDA
jgi:hypothetical protein